MAMRVVKIHPASLASFWQDGRGDSERTTVLPADTARDFERAIRSSNGADIRLVGAPDVVVQAGQTALFYNSEFSEHASATGRLTRDIGLAVIPSVDGKYVQLDVRDAHYAAGDDIEQATGASGKNFPAKVKVKTEETLLIAGQMERENSDGESSALADLPLIGNWFEAEKAAGTDYQVVFAVTPILSCR